MNLKKMSCCMLAVGMIASMNLASFADSTVQAETPLSVEQSASAEQDVNASAYYIDENGNEVPMEVETTVRSLGKTLTRSGEEAENFEVRVTARAYESNSSVVNFADMLCEATATAHYTKTGLMTKQVYAESGEWTYANGCRVVDKYYSLNGNKHVNVYLSDDYDSFYDQTTSVGSYIVYQTHGTIVNSDGFEKKINVRVNI